MQMQAIDLLTYKGARELFGTLCLFPQRQFTISELAKTAHLPFTTTWKLVKKFEQAQVVDVTLIGRSRAVNYRDGPFPKLLRRIMRMSAAPLSGCKSIGNHPSPRF